MARRRILAATMAWNCQLPFPPDVSGRLSSWPQLCPVAVHLPARSSRGQGDLWPCMLPARPPLLPSRRLWRRFDHWPGPLPARYACSPACLHRYPPPTAPHPLSSLHSVLGRLDQPIAARHGGHARSLQAKAPPHGQTDNPTQPCNMWPVRACRCCAASPRRPSSQSQS